MQTKNQYDEVEEQREVDAAEAPWYVITVLGGTEEKAVERIKCKADASLYDCCWIPTRTERRKFNGEEELIRHRIFTGYVFIEINTIAGCGLIMVRQLGKSIVTAVRYMVISMLGSGLFLIGVTLLYTLTGHLLMSNIQESVKELISTGDYGMQLTIVIGLMTVGLAIKAGLFPFHLWIPDAYGQSNVISSSLLSSTVSKGYIFLLIKIYFRTLGLEAIEKSGVLNVCFALGIVAMIMGSVLALNEKSFRRMIAFSSIAQIGYIFMGIGIGTKEAVTAAIFHIFAHGLTKSLLFISSSEFT